MTRKQIKPIDLAGISRIHPIPFLTFVFSLFSCHTFSQEITPQSVVQKQLETYNNRDIEGFMALFHEDVRLYNHSDGRLLADGKADVRELYSNLFEKSPKLHSDLLNRMVLDRTVIDHEKITGRMGNDTPIELIVIYEIEELKIIKVTVIR